MRLGADPVKLHDGTRAREIYGEAVIYERHRHRYEVSLNLRKRLEEAGLVVSGTSPDERLVECIELPDHPFFVASQYHPEFKSRPERPAPLFREFVARRAGARRGARRRRASRGARLAGGRGSVPARPTDVERARLHELFAQLCRIRSAVRARARDGRARAAASCGRWARGLEDDAAADRRDAATSSPASPGRRSARSCCAPTSTRCPTTARSSRSRSTGAGRTPTTTSSAPTTRPPSRSCSWPPSARSPAAARRHRAAVHASGGERPQRRRGLRRRRAALRLRLRLRPRHADRRDRHGRAELLPPDRALPRPRRARRHPPAGRARGDRRRRQGDRRACAWVAWTTRRRPTSGTIEGGVGRHERRARALLVPGRGALAGATQARGARRRDDRPLHVAANDATCDVDADVTVEKVFTGYRHKPRRPRRPRRRGGAARVRLRAPADRSRRRLGRQRARAQRLPLRVPGQRHRAQPRAARARLLRRARGHARGHAGAADEIAEG